MKERAFLPLTQLSLSLSVFLRYFVLLCTYTKSKTELWCFRKINLRDRKVFNAHWHHCGKSFRWKYLCISAQLCTGYMECSLCHDQSWALHNWKSFTSFSCAYWLSRSPDMLATGPESLSHFNGWKIMDGNRNTDAITSALTTMLTTTATTIITTQRQ